MPRSYYAGIFVVNLVGAMVLLAFYPLQLPVWGLFLAIAIAVVFLVPVGIIAAITCVALLASSPEAIKADPSRHASQQHGARAQRCAPLPPRSGIAPQRLTRVRFAPQSHHRVRRRLDLAVQAARQRRLQGLWLHVPAPEP